MIRGVCIAALFVGCLTSCGEEKKGNGDAGPEYEFNGFHEVVDGMNVIWLWGTYEEMGYAEGALLCGSLTRTIQEMVHGNELLATVGVDTTVAAIELIVEVPVQSQQQMRGMIKGMQEHCPPEELILTSENFEGGSREIMYEDLLIQNFNGPVASLLCSSLTVWGEASASGATIHARNVDTGSGDYSGVRLTEKVAKVYRSTEDGNLRWISLNVPGRLGCTTCFNEEGGGITSHWAGSSALPNSADRGLHNGEVVRKDALLATIGAADRVAAADAILEAAPVTGGGNMHMCIPCSGDDCIGGVVFERDGNFDHPDGMATDRRPGDVDEGFETTSAIACTNHYMERIQLDPPPLKSNLRHGILVRGINEALTNGGLDVDGALELMAAVAIPELSAPTYYTSIIDTSTMILYMHYAESMDVQAPWTEPHVLPLAEMFSRFPE